MPPRATGAAGHRPHIQPRFIADRGLEVDRLFTDRWTLDRAEEAYRSFDKQAAGKGVFVS